MRLLLPQLLTLTLLANMGRAANNELPLTLLVGEQLAGNAIAVTGPNGEPAIQVKGGPAPTTTRILDCAAPAVNTHTYVVRGSVKYEDVTGAGYLELWNDFGSHGKFFTRSLGEWGRMQKLSGSSNWRTFELPFRAESGMRPEKLTLNVVLPGTGTVTVSQPSLIVVDTSTQWWTEPQAGLRGGLMGSLMGILGAVLGGLAAWGKMRQLTLSLFVMGLIISGICLIVGLIALAIQQPWHVCYPLLLLGVIGLSVLGGNLWTLLRRYQADELRRMAAVNA